MEAASVLPQLVQEALSSIMLSHWCRGQIDRARPA